jgi:hypothetical protein
MYLALVGSLAGTKALCVIDPFNSIAASTIHSRTKKLRAEDLRVIYYVIVVMQGV